MRFKEMESEQALRIILQSDTLRRKFDEYIMDVEMDYITDKLNCFDRSCADWEFGFYNQNHLRVRNENYSDFLAGIRKSASMYGLSEKLYKLLSQTEKLNGTNLFAYHVEKVCKRFFEEEIEDVREYVEDVSFAMYCKDIDKFYELGADSYLECFTDWYLDDYYYDEEEQEVYQIARKVS